MHEKIANTTSTSALVEKVVGRMVRERTQKQASQLSPNSVSNQENSSSEQYVTNKLRHTGENYAPAGQTSYGLQQQRDLVNQGPNTGPLADTVNDLPQNRDPKHDIPDNPIMDCFDSAGEPPEGTKEPDSQGDPVSEKLQLKKDASALLARLDETSKLGQQITDRLMSLIVAQKTGSIAEQPVYTPESVLNEIQNKNAAANPQQPVNPQQQPVNQQAAEERQILKEAATELAENVIHAANLTAAAIKAAAAGPGEGEEIPGDAAMQAPLGAGADAGAGVPAEGEIPPEAAQALMGESLQENGVLPGDFGGGLPAEGGAEGAAEGGVEGGVEGGGDETTISPEEMALFQEAMAQSGISPEEINQAIAEIQAEEGAGISPADAGLADEEALKTGHYKFASLTNRQAKTAEQEKRAATIRGVVREFCRGVDTANFN
jgi:hypothetical protein